MKSITDIAAKLRQHSPGCLPESLNDDLTFNEWDGGGVAKCQLPDDIAEDVLIAVMVMDARLERGATGCHWLAYPGPDTCQMFSDPDFGGHLGSAYAAWLCAKGLPHA